MKYSIVASALFSGALAAWAPPAGYSAGSWGTSSAPAAAVSSSAAAPSYPAGGWSSAPAPVYSSAAAVSSSAAAAPSYPTGGWSSAPAPVYSSAAPVYSTGWGTSTVEVTTVVTVTSCAAYVTDCPAASSPAAPYPSSQAGAWSSSPVVIGTTGTAAPYPSASTWAPVPATGAGSTAQTGGILAAAGALFALFL